LQRARVRLRELPSRKPPWPASVDGNAAERDLLKKYVEASESADFRAFESIIRADATFRMPPEPDTAAGREAMFRLWIEGGFGSERIWSPPLHCDPRQSATGGRSLRVPARRFCLACHGSGCCSNRGRLNHGDYGVPAG